MAIPLLWVGIIVGASIAFRLNHGKPIFPKVSRDTLYREGWGTGRSLDTLWGRFGGAHNCLIIAITNDTLTVAPRFPFNLMFLPEIYGLELAAPRSAVHVENPASGLLRTGVIIAVEGVDAKRMELKPRDRERFLSALRQR